MKLVFQPEIAYLKNDTAIMDATDPPEGYLFKSASLTVPDDFDQIELYELIAEHLREVEVW